MPQLTISLPLARVPDSWPRPVVVVLAMVALAALSARYGVSLSSGTWAAVVAVLALQGYLIVATGVR